MLEIFDIPHIITTYGYLGIAVIVFLESSIFFALPGDSLLFTAGVLASNTYLEIYWLIPLIFGSTFLGAIAGYYIGVHIERLRRYSFFRKILKDEHIIKAHDFFDKYGKLAMILSRFLPIIRTFTPMAAGIARMHYALFIKYNLISSIIWSTSVTLVGYFLGRIFPAIGQYLPWLIVAVILISILPAVVKIFRRKES